MRQSLAVSVLVSRGLTTRLDAIFDVANSMLASRRDIPGKRLKLPKLTRHRTRRDLSVHWHTNPKHQPARASPRFLTRFKKRPLAVWICDLEHAFFLSIDRPRKDSQEIPAALGGEVSKSCCPRGGAVIAGRRTSSWAWGTAPAKASRSLPVDEDRRDSAAREASGEKRDDGQLARLDFPGT